MTYSRADGIADDDWDDDEELEDWDELDVDDEDLWLDEEDY
jgi:hypothetical protein